LPLDCEIVAFQALKTKALIYIEKNLISGLCLG